MHYYEIDFADGYGMAIKSSTSIGFDDRGGVEAWLREHGDADLADTGIVNIIESSIEEIIPFYDCEKINSWPVYGNETSIS